MEVKFTPWRMNYIKGSVETKIEGCVLCTLHQAKPAQDKENLVLYRGKECYVVMNLYPYNTGHLMVVPYEHVADLPGMNGATAQELFELTRRCVALLGAEYQPQGFNLGMNLGRTAGAGIDEHLHMHIVPRWSGDTNYMPIIGGAKLIPEALEQTYARLRPRFEQG
ncbi:MAG: HIT domain-containing protein [Chloroflexales bacterium]|nr:HIT domain-containing protein [Chloroflexales bacterium]